MTTNAISPSGTRNAKDSGLTSSRPVMRKLLPAGFFLVATVLLVVSIRFPYRGPGAGSIPQYPEGLEMRVFVNYMTGDEDPKLDEVREIDDLNQNISSMKSLYEAKPSLERSIANPRRSAIMVAPFWKLQPFWSRRWTWLLTLPALSFPIVFLADLAFWMNHFLRAES